MWVANFVNNNVTESRSSNRRAQEREIGPPSGDVLLSQGVDPVRSIGRFWLPSPSGRGARSVVAAPGVSAALTEAQNRLQVNRSA
jgi:hypothetical protein